MNLNSVILAVEDTLSDAVSTKILESFGIEIMLRIGFKGNSYLRTCFKSHLIRFRIK